MDIITTNTNITYEKFQKTYENFDFINSVFFDIETTGFASKNTKLYMIGVLYVSKITKTFHTTQWFLDDYNDELNILTSFTEFIKDYHTLIHFNGNGFDIPYLLSKAETYDIEIPFNSFQHIDLYKISTKLKNFLKTENLKLKTLEIFFGLEREDEFSGKDLIDVYRTYMETKNNNLKDFLILHNYEDLKGMLTVINILAYDNILNNHFSYKDLAFDIEHKELILEYVLDIPINQRISIGYDNIYITAFDSKLKIKLPLYTEELKYFYENYRDYYYLPQEDMAIHKSVATYVDKEYRTKAKASNCYIRKASTFLKQYTNIINPQFKNSYNDKISFFEFNEDFYNNKDLLKQYTSHILNYLAQLK